MNKKALIIFTRVPVPGHTKTRLMPYFNGNQCAGLHRAMLMDINNESKALSIDRFIFYTPEDSQGELQKIFGGEVFYEKQQGSDLGEKMENALEAVLEKGYESCVLIGTDVPEISNGELVAAFTKLNNADVVFGPTLDGGYYLVGMKSLQKSVFHNQSYGHNSVLENTLAALEEDKLKVDFVKELSDIDTKEDIYIFRNRITMSKALQKLSTSQFLMDNRRISIIVPLYNEESTIVKLQKQLTPLKDKCEIIFVDGGSTDKTLELIDPGFKVVSSPKGRGNQMNYGAGESTGDVLLFLHCDSELPENPLEEITEVMKKYRVGCFGIRFNSQSGLMRICGIMSNRRVKDRKIIFGDQGIFIDRKLFFDIGMFPDLPLMEDYELSIRLKKCGEKPGLTKERIITSDRRFPKGTIPKLQLMMKMQKLQRMYRHGVPIEKISAMYRDVR